MNLIADSLYSSINASHDDKAPCGFRETEPCHLHSPKFSLFARRDDQHPPNSSWTSGPHWHETHTEYLRVIQGTAKVALSGHTRIVRPSDGIIVIPKFAVHEWSRVDPAGSGGEVFDAEETLVVEEWTDPTDGLKNVFFRNLNGVILDETQGGKSPPRSEWWLTLQLWVIFHGLDNWPVVVDGPLWLRWIITHLILRLGVFVGKLWHLQAIYPEYTPDGLIPGGPKVNKGD